MGYLLHGFEGGGFPGPDNGGDVRSEVAPTAEPSAAKIGKFIGQLKKLTPEPCWATLMLSYFHVFSGGSMQKAGSGKSTNRSCRSIRAAVFLSSLFRGKECVRGDGLCGPA